MGISKQQEGTELKAILEKTIKDIGKFYKREETKAAAGRYLKGLLSRVDRKNSWQKGFENPYRFQHLLDRARWNEEDLRDFHGKKFVLLWEEWGAR